MKAGKVYLVGAGPGDPGLISVKGVNCLKKAEVIIYDRLLDQSLLEFAPPGAERIYLGKTTGEAARQQVEINNLLVSKAKEGKTVVRLKGGDPFVLGRGGEEAEVLVQNKVPFEVVPGVTSAVAVPAYAGIPVTHRGLASSFAVITGHEAAGKSSIDWQKLATGIDTLIFLMGMGNLPEIVTKLVENGRPPDTPVAVIREGTRPEQETVVASLEDIVARAEESHLTAPAIIVVGNVVSLREKLRWFDNRPLFGKRILVTRARHQASALSRLLSERGAQPIELPAIDIQEVTSYEELDGAIANLKEYHWIIFTSVNAVEAFWQRLNSLKLDSRALAESWIAAIGPATGQALQNRGVIPDYMPEVYTTESIVAGLKKFNLVGHRFLLPRADIADEKLAREIYQLGATVDEVTAYRTVPAVEAIAQAKEVIASGKIDVVTFTSQR